MSRFGLPTVKRMKHHSLRKELSDLRRRYDAFRKNVEGASPLSGWEMKRMGTLRVELRLHRT